MKKRARELPVFIGGREGGASWGKPQESNLLRDIEGF